MLLFFIVKEAEGIASASVGGLTFLRKMAKIVCIRPMKGENLVGNFKKTLAGMMAFCLLMSTLTPAHPLASPRGEGFAPAAINSPLFCLFFSRLLTKLLSWFILHSVIYDNFSSIMLINFFSASSILMSGI